MDTTTPAPGEAVANEVADLLVQRLREDQPFMSVDAIQEISKACQGLIVGRVEAQLPAIEQSKSRICFLDLPPELRTIIYELVLVDSGVRAYSKERGYVALTQPALTKICRTVRAETLDIFYGKNKLRFENDRSFLDLACWMLENVDEISTDVVEMLSREDSVQSSFRWFERIGADNVARVKDFGLLLDEGDSTHSLSTEVCELKKIVQQVFERMSMKYQVTLPSSVTVEPDEQHARPALIEARTMRFRFPAGDDPEEYASAASKVSEAGYHTSRDEAGKGGRSYEA